MGKEAGTNVLLKVSSGSPSSYVTVGGQQSTEFTGATETADVTDKANGGWGSTITTLIRGTVAVSGVVDFPDTLGWEVIRAAWEARTTVDARLVMDAAGKNYTGMFAVTSFNVSGTHTGAVEYSVTLENADQLVYAATE
jgi:TP901-1 family phage major tail protein